MPWEVPHSESKNRDLFYLLFPLEEAQLKPVVQRCSNPLALYRSCVQNQPASLEDWEAAQQCQQLLDGLKKCSERALAETFKKSRDRDSEAKFMLRGDH